MHQGTTDAEELVQRLELHRIVFKRRGPQAPAQRIAIYPEDGVHNVGEDLLHLAQGAPIEQDAQLVHALEKRQTEHRQQAALEWKDIRAQFVLPRCSQLTLRFSGGMVCDMVSSCASKLS